MPRPQKYRKVCGMPERNSFGPLGEDNLKESIVMTVDEFETIRLIDLEELTQEECALQMEIARTTVQSIYSKARKKLAESLILGKKLQINGGHYSLCSQKNCHRCCRGKGKKPSPTNYLRGGNEMLIALPYDNEDVFQHFGKTEIFKIYKVENNKVTGTDIISTNGSGHDALSGLLKDLGVSVLICGGIGGCAVDALTEDGIQIYKGVQGRVDEVVDDYVTGRLVHDPDAVCNHSHEDGQEGCGH